jgi:hypothetical protein
MEKWIAGSAALEDIPNREDHGPHDITYAVSVSKNFSKELICLSVKGTIEPCDAPGLSGPD